MKIKKYFFLLVLFSLLTACVDDGDQKEGEYDGYTLVWADEFNSSLSPDNWVYETGDGTDYGLPPGWGNAEKQIYTTSSQNSIVLGDEEGNSVLAIIAKKEPGNNNYSSAKITTQGLHSFRFGRVEARIKVPEGKGMWPAFWMMGDNADELDWPGCGEIDVMEVIGNAPSVVNSTVHFTNIDNKHEGDGSAYDAGVNLSDDYHVYRLDWNPESLSFYMDDNLVHEVMIEEDMKEFLRSFYLIFNVAVGGNWPGDPDESTVFPQRMLIDWVRVYSKDDMNIPEEPDLDIAEETLGNISFDLPKYAFNESLGQFEDLVVKTYGDGGEPDITTSDLVVDGDSSLVLAYPGEGWGGAFFILEPVIDASDLAGTTLKFSLNLPDEVTDIEIKLESVATAVSLFLKDYTGVDVGQGYLEYAIPVSDFEGLSLVDLKIPFALWNPKVAGDEYFQGEILLDNIYFE
jgi:beta-glucanase (GH16 family)